MTRFDEEWEDLREAAAWLTTRRDAQGLARLTYSLWVYVWMRGHLPDSREWVAAALTADAGLPPLLRGRLCFLAGGLAFEAGEYPRALDLFERAIELFEEADDDEGLAWAHYILAATLPAFGADAEEIDSELCFALRRFRAAGDLWGQCWALTNLGMLAAASGDVDRAVAHHTECLDLAARLDDPSMLAQAHTQLGFTYLSSGRLEPARASLARAVAIHRRSSFREGLSYCLDALAGLALQDGHAERAMIALGAAEGIRQRLGLRPWPAVKWYLDFLGSAADAVQDDDLQASRAAGREMDPLAAAAFALGQA
jgi:tetratricopeptide (TPR) repeat protein